MKKIILLISILLLTGCYDYVELNDLSIITGIAVDKDNGNYVVSFEILNDKKSSSETVTMNSLVVSDKGKSLSLAFANATKKVPKLAFYSHLKTLIISEEVATNDIPQIIDFFIRSPRIRNEFYVLISDNTSALSILKNSTDANPVVSNQLETMIKTNKLRKNNTTPYTFEEILENYFNNQIDAAITTLKLKEQNISLEGLALYDDYKLKKIISADNSTIYNILTNNAKKVDYQYSCGQDKYIDLSIYKADTKINIKNKRVLINLDVEASITQYNCSKSLKDEETYIEYNKIYAKEISKQINSFYQELLKNNTDVLGIGNLYYTKYRQKTNWKDLDYKINTKLRINKDGLIFEVNDDY